MMVRDEFDEAVASGDDERIVAALEAVARRPSTRAACDRIKRLIGTTSSALVRNAAALALADLKAEDAESVLVQLLRRDDTKGARGTLLYALEELEASVPLSVLVQIIEEDTYEAREEALDLLANNRAQYDKPELDRANQLLKTLARNRVDRDAARAAREALRLLARSPVSSRLQFGERAR